MGSCCYRRFKQRRGLLPAAEFMQGRYILKPRGEIVRSPPERLFVVLNCLAAVTGSGIRVRELEVERRLRRPMLLDRLLEPGNPGSKVRLIDNLSGREIELGFESCG